MLFFNTLKSCQTATFESLQAKDSVVQIGPGSCPVGVSRDLQRTAFSLYNSESDKRRLQAKSGQAQLAIGQFYIKMI